MQKVLKLHGIIIAIHDLCCQELWEEFMQTMQKPMPIVVRINRTKPHWQEMFSVHVLHIAIPGWSLAWSLLFFFQCQTCEELHQSFAQDSRWSQLPWFPSAWQCSAGDYDDSLRSQCSALNKSYALRFQDAWSKTLLFETQTCDVVEEWKTESAKLAIGSPTISLLPWTTGSSILGASIAFGGNWKLLDKKCNGLEMFEALQVKPSDLLLDMCAAPGHGNKPWIWFCNVLQYCLRGLRGWWFQKQKWRYSDVGSKTLECIELMREATSEKQEASRPFLKFLLILM